MKTISIVFLFLSTAGFAAKLSPCGYQYFCPLFVDSTQECAASDGKQTFSEKAHPREDNACLVTLRLRDKICGAGEDSSQFDLKCH